MKSMLWKIWFIFFMLICLLAYLLLILSKLILPYKAYRKVVHVCVRFWGRTTVHSTGSKVEVLDAHKLPDSENVCFVANHQGMFDIPLVLGFIDRPCGFIAKKRAVQDSRFILVDARNPLRVHRSNLSPQSNRFFCHKCGCNQSGAPYGDISRRYQKQERQNGRLSPG